MNSAILRRYVPQIVWALVIGTLIAIPFKIASYGYLPPDDALRHAAKAVSGKSWQEIIVLRPEYSMDHNFGWHFILGWIHHQFDVGTEGLVVFSVVALLLLVLGIALPWCGRPESWAATLLLFSIALPTFMGRYALGRPFLLTVAAMVAVLFLWKPRDNRRISGATILFTVVAFAVSVWVHGAWCLLALPAIAFFLACQWRSAIALTACWLTGSFLGAALTGHPWQYLWQAVSILTSTFGHYTNQRLMVGEFRPSAGDFNVLIIVSLCTWYRLRKGLSFEQILIDPIFILMSITWLAGLQVQRFWLDWGLPAALLWCLPAVDCFLKERFSSDSIQRLFLAAIVAAGLFSIVTNDLDSRWTMNLTTDYLNADDPAMKDWLPEKNGIFYCADMATFYRTFFKNPNAPWRYIRGFEASLMPKDDLQTVRNIDWNYNSFKAYAPWVEKIRPEDRLIIPGSGESKPTIPRLEWKYPIKGLWLGRLPKATNAVSAASNPGR